jgi:hypothetical protein
VSDLCNFVLLFLGKILKSFAEKMEKGAGRLLRVIRKNAIGGLYFLLFGVLLWPMENTGISSTVRVTTLPAGASPEARLAYYQLLKLQVSTKGAGSAGRTDTWRHTITGTDGSAVALASPATQENLELGR